MRRPLITVVFVCPADGARSVLAAALFEAHADRGLASAVALAARPAEAPAAALESVLREAGVSARTLVADAWTPTVETSAQFVVEFEAPDALPANAPRHARWPVAAPDASPESLRAARDEIRRRVRALIARAGWSVGTWL